MTDELDDRRLARTRRLEFERQQDLRRLADMDEFTGMVTRIRALYEARGNPPDMMSVPDPAAEAEQARQDARGRRLALAGVSEPEAGTGAHAAFWRVIRATGPADAAKEGHSGSLRAMTEVEAFMSARQQTCVVRGAPGRGKTVAAWFALAGIDHGLIIGAAQVNASYESGWQTLVTRALAAQLLVMNDLSERLSPWQWGQFADVLEARHDFGRRTIVTTNLTTAQLIAALGPRCDDRFGQAVLIQVDGESMRRA